MATNSSTLACRIPWIEEPGGLQSTGLQSWTQVSDFHFFNGQFVPFIFLTCLSIFDFLSVQFSSVAQSYPTLCNPMNCSSPRPPCPSPTPGVHPNSCPLSQWCHPTISSSVVPFSRPQSFPASGSFQMRQLFASGDQSIGVSASVSVLPMNTQDWSPLGWTGWISLKFL